MDTTSICKDVIINEVILEPKKIQPILVDFLHTKIEEQDLENMKCHLFKNTKNNKSVIGISNDFIVYKGNQPDPIEEPVQTMIGIYNKRAGTMKLVGCEEWEVIPVLDKLPETRTEFDEQAVMAVNKEFGSHKVKRRTEQYEKMKINVDSVSEQLEDIAANITIEQEDLTSTVSDDFTANYLPRCNRDATSVFGVYDIYDIIPQNILKTLYQSVNNILENGFEDESPFFQNPLQTINMSNNVKQHVAALIYMRAICKWLEIPIRDTKKFEAMQETLQITPEVVNHLINNYTVQSQNGRQRPPMQRDKALAHSIILYLIINHYNINLELFAKAINVRIGIKKLMEFARTIGLTTQKEKNEYILKLPLPAPPPAVKSKWKNK